MKRNIIIIFVLINSTILFAQENQFRNSIRFSYNQVDISLAKKLKHYPISIEGFLGIANQDINREFDDINTGVRFGTKLLSGAKYELVIALGVGVYIPRNEYYTAVTPLYTGAIEYNRFFGKSEKHCILVNIGYKYGKRNYKQEYQSSEIYVATLGEFKVSPLYIAVGYGFNF